MMKATSEVKALPNYSTSGEVVLKLFVHTHTVLTIVYVRIFCFDSGLSQMLDMTPPLMPFTLLYLAYPGGNNINCVYTYIIFTLGYIYTFKHYIAPNKYLLVQLCPEKSIL